MKNLKKEHTLLFFSKVDKALSLIPSFNKKNPILLAVSGGADSMAMLYYFLKKRRNIVVAHFNHKIRGAEADRDEKFVERFCFENSVPLIKGRADIPTLARERKESLEHVARKKRYEFLLKVAVECGADIICTAHHADDNAETFFINLLRGTKLYALAGIPRIRKLDGKTILRPLLDVSKKEIVKMLKANKVPWIEDSSNEEEKYLRNWIRKTLLPTLEKKQPKIREHISIYCHQIMNVRRK